jgi:hypothetical protein
MDIDITLIQISCDSEQNSSTGYCVQVAVAGIIGLALYRQISFTVDGIQAPSSVSLFAASRW